jgi:hypothetical protein
MSTKVFLEAIQVARHVGRIGARPIEKAAVQVLSASEEVAKTVLTLPPVQDTLGKHRTKQVWDSYLQVKNVGESLLVALSHQSLMSGLQSGSEYATQGMQHAGIEGRVIGPLDEHWNVQKVIKDLRHASEKDEMDSKAGRKKDLSLTPKRFVQFMREAQRKKKRSLRRDPIEGVVDKLLNSGNVSGFGPLVFEKKIYKDVAGIICFAFDRALVQADGSRLWGHELYIKRRPAREIDAEAYRIPPPSNVTMPQVEAVVDQMLLSEDLRVMLPLKGVQRQLLVNCSMMMLQLLEHLTSHHRMKVSVLGHSLRFRLEPLPLEQVLGQVAMANDEGSINRFHVNTQAVDELVEALLEDPETQMVFVPDLLEAEVYRAVLRRPVFQVRCRVLTGLMASASN